MEIQKNKKIGKPKNQKSEEDSEKKSKACLTVIFPNLGELSLCNTSKEVEHWTRHYHEKLKTQRTKIAEEKDFIGGL